MYGDLVLRPRLSSVLVQAHKYSSIREYRGNTLSCQDARQLQTRYLTHSQSSIQNKQHLKIFGHARGKLASPLTTGCSGTVVKLEAAQAGRGLIAGG